MWINLTFFERDFNQNKRNKQRTFKFGWQLRNWMTSSFVHDKLKQLLTMYFCSKMGNNLVRSIALSCDSRILNQNPDCPTTFKHHPTTTFITCVLLNPLHFLFLPDAQKVHNKVRCRINHTKRRHGGHCFRHKLRSRTLGRRRRAHRSRHEGNSTRVWPKIDDGLAFGEFTASYSACGDSSALLLLLWWPLNWNWQLCTAVWWSLSLWRWPPD